MIRAPYIRLYVLALGHGLNDFIAGYMLGIMAGQESSAFIIAGCFLVYNILAFGGQYLAALLLRHQLSTKQALVLTWVLNAAALGVFALSPVVAFVLSGCASALYHVAGGTIAASQNKATSIGLFAAPGVIGLASAGYAAWSGAVLWWPLLAACTACLLFSIKTRWNGVSFQPSSSVVHPPVIDRHDLLMILLLSAIALRSAVWTIFQVVHQEQILWLLVIGGSAFVGKLLGGWISDRVGWRLYSLLSLSVASPLVHFFSKDLVLFCIGIALLQSGIPASTALLVQYMQYEKEKAIANAFGAAVIVGGGISYLLYKTPNKAMVPLLGMLLILSFLILRYRSKMLLRSTQQLPQPVIPSDSSHALIQPNL